MDLIAHTPPKENPDAPPHGYAEHIHEVLNYGVPLFKYLLSFSPYSEEQKISFIETFEAALMLHDMGKLDEANQQVFRGEVSGALPVDHIEAGVAIADEMKNELLGWLIRGHHSPGFPNRKTEKYFIRELKKAENLELSDFCLRGRRHKRDKLFDDFRSQHAEAILLTNYRLQTYKDRQISSCGKWPELTMKLPETALLPRLMLSCLVDADHGSAASYSQGATMDTFHPLDCKWQERLESLDGYVTALSAGPVESDANKRNKMRAQFYHACRHGDLYDSRLACCSAPVGLGKTTSVLAYLLRCAIQQNLSRIFVVAPFSNIIDQTINVLRKAIVLEGEDAEKIVVAHHHKADFSNKDMRKYAASWNAPVVVTTSVQFFETLAEADPTRLRKLHNVVGSGVFVDESHACLPPTLLDVTWYWINQLSESWGCFFVFSSGSMVRFWEDQILVSEQRTSLPDLLPSPLRSITQEAEKKRIHLSRLEKPVTCDELVAFVQLNSVWDEYIDQVKPCCLVILNTVQSAAVFAKRLSHELQKSRQKIRDKIVLHLSTALAPKDRAKMLEEVLRRQRGSEWDNRIWYLVATSCVEAGIDLDFSIGFRETCSVSSFIQVSGRINRHDKRTNGKLFDFSIIEDGEMVRHPGFRESEDVFSLLWNELVHDDLDSSSLCTKAVRKEYSRFPKNQEKSKILLSNEKSREFQEIANEYKLIESCTLTVIVDKTIVEKLENGFQVDWQEIQEHSVQLWSNRVYKLGLREIKGCIHDDIYSWIDTYEYDPDFLGVMAGILDPNDFFQRSGGVL